MYTFDIQSENALKLIFLSQQLSKEQAKKIKFVVIFESVVEDVDDDDVKKSA